MKNIALPSLAACRRKVTETWPGEAYETSMERIFDNGSFQQASCFPLFAVWILVSNKLVKAVDRLGICPCLDNIRFLFTNPSEERREQTKHL